MSEPRVRVYADTSVFGGVFDVEFEWASRAFFQEVREGRFALVVSAVVRGELVPAPMNVRELLEEMLPLAEALQTVPEAVALADAYVAAGVVSSGSLEDALHVALATVSGCAVIVSWNFRHIVHLERIAQYNAVNAARGYRPIEIRSPLEVISYEDEEEGQAV